MCVVKVKPLANAAAQITPEELVGKKGHAHDGHPRPIGGQQDEHVTFIMTGTLTTGTLALSADNAT